MNTKFQLFIIVIIAVFSLSLDFSTNSKDANESVLKEDAKEYVANATEKKMNGSVLISTASPESAAPITAGNQADSTVLYTCDDGIFHFFHFNRIKRLRKRVKNRCFFIRLFLVYTHIAVIILEFISILSH